MTETNSNKMPENAKRLFKTITRVEEHLQYWAKVPIKEQVKDHDKLLAQQVSVFDDVRTYLIPWAAFNASTLIGLQSDLRKVLKKLGDADLYPDQAPEIL